MGTWGTGNFDGDGPCDFLDGVIDNLEQEIEDCFGPDEMSLGTGEDVLVPAIQIWSALHEKCGGHTPQPEQVKKWKEAYLPVYDKHMPELADETFVAERRKVIVDTFEKLEKQAVEFWNSVGKSSCPTQGVNKNV
jgi:hypothetical protein